MSIPTFQRVGDLDSARATVSRLQRLISQEEHRRALESAEAHRRQNVALSRGNVSLTAKEGNILREERSLRELLRRQEGRISVLQQRIGAEEKRDLLLARPPQPAANLPRLHMEAVREASRSRCVTASRVERELKQSASSTRAESAHLRHVQLQENKWLLERNQARVRASRAAHAEMAGRSSAAMLQAKIHARKDVQMWHTDARDALYREVSSHIEVLRKQLSQTTT